MSIESAFLFIGFFFIALLYSAVGQAGGSSYVALMLFLQLTPDEIKSTSLLLNIIVASIASVRYLKDGKYDARILQWTLASGIPCAILASFIILTVDIYIYVAIALLILSAMLLLLRPQRRLRFPSRLHLILLGVLIGSIAGIVGIGGGVFLTPALLLFGWTTIELFSGTSSLYNLLSSLAGLIGFLMYNPVTLSSEINFMLPAVIAGGFFGSYLNVKVMSGKWIRYLLAFVLLMVATMLWLR